MNNLNQFAFVFFQLTVQDLPNAPPSLPSSKENEDILEGLPDVPTKTPVASDVVANDAEVSSKKKGFSLSLSHAHAHTYTHMHRRTSIHTQFKSNFYVTIFLKRSIGGATASVILDLRSLLSNCLRSSMKHLPVVACFQSCIITNSLACFNYGCVNFLLAFWFTKILIIYCTDLIVTNTTTVVLLKTGILQTEFTKRKS